MEFTQVKGEQRAKRMLFGSFENKRIPNAFLFCGQNLAEMRQIAVDYSSLLNCHTLCGKCSSCSRIKKGVYPDVLELEPREGRQTIGIEQIWELQELIKYGPSEGSYFAVLICESERLTPEAFNCLLKTLEEPPKRVVFILTSAREDHLPRTVISRCQKVLFTNPAEEEVYAGVKLPSGQLSSFLSFSKELASDKDTLMPKLYAVAKHFFGLKRFSDSRIVLDTARDIKRKANKRIALDHMALRLGGAL